tara:strand:+ start:969 stop:1208 length:240 start_codon:yes stop_codon:yes gene_type:complete
MDTKDPVTIEDYKLVHDEFFQKYNFVAERMGGSPKAEDVLKVMEALTGVVMRERAKDKVGPFGFNKQSKDETTISESEG